MDSSKLDDTPRGYAEAGPLPTLAVVVPVLNEAGAAQSLAQRLSQLSDFQIIVVDGGSIDQTVRLLGDTTLFSRLLRHAGGYKVLRGGGGRGAQMNQGARSCKADVLVFLHADTSFTPQHARAAQRAVAGGADFGCFTLRIDSENPWLLLVGRLVSLRSRLLPSATGDQAIFIRRRLFERLGGYREIPLCEDIDLISRAQARGRFVCINKSVCTSARRWQQHGVLRTILLMWLLRLGFHLGVHPATLKRLYEDVR